MELSSIHLSLIALGVVLLVVAWSYFPKPKYHPGPTPLPLIGNLLQIPRETPWVTYKEWSEQYGESLHSSVLQSPLSFTKSPQPGPCIHLEVVGKHVLVLNEGKDAEELFSKRGLSNSERPHLVMAGELVGFGRGLALLPYDEDAREARKLIHLTVGAKNLTTYTTLLEAETMRYLRGLRDTPENFLNHLK